MAKDQFRIEDPILHPFSILKEKYGGYIIEEFVTRTSKDGIPTVVGKPIRYPVTLESAVKWIIESKIASNGGVLSLKDFLTEYNSLKSQIDQLVGA